MPVTRVSIDELLADAPRAVDSFCDGHWALMGQLEREAQAVLASENVDKTVKFLARVAYLKQPYRVDQKIVQEQIARHPDRVRAAIRALQRVSELDYRAMNTLAKVPWFGINGGRAFNSAVMRLVHPESFGIIDWRNLAVIMGAIGFEGLIDPPERFSDLTPEDVLAQKGYLTLTQSIYQKYNDALRKLARRYSKRVSEIDLAIWTYSIRKQPFQSDGRSYGTPGTPSFVMRDLDRQMLLRDHRGVADRLVQDYLAALSDLGYLSRQRVSDALRDIFCLIRNECELFGRNKRGKLREKVSQVVDALNQAIARPDPNRFQAMWDRWHGMIDPASPTWIGISLPTEMVLEGYLVFEDFLPIKRYFETYYEPDTLAPRSSED